MEYILWENPNTIYTQTDKSTQENTSTNKERNTNKELVIKKDIIINNNETKVSGPQEY